MADPLVDAGGHKPVVLPDLETRREALGEVGVRPPQKPEGLEEEGSPQGACQEACGGREAVVRKVEPGGEEVEEGDDDHAQGREEHQRPVLRFLPVLFDLSPISPPVRRPFQPVCAYNPHSAF